MRHTGASRTIPPWSPYGLNRAEYLRSHHGVPAVTGSVPEARACASWTPAAQEAGLPAAYNGRSVAPSYLLLVNKDFLSPLLEQFVHRIGDHLVIPDGDADTASFSRRTARSGKDSHGGKQQSCYCEGVGSDLDLHNSFSGSAPCVFT